MRNRSLWAFGILLGFILAYIGWDSFEMSMIWASSKNVNGRIIEVFPSKEVRTYTRRVKYVYSVNDKFYYDFEKLGTRVDKQFIGNKVRVSYSVRNPNNSQVVRFINDHKSLREIKFYSNKEQGFFEFRLINGIFKYKEYAEKGKVINDFIGDYTIVGDTLKFRHYYFELESIGTTRPELFIADSANGNQLIEVNTNRIFKKVITRR